MKTVKRQPLPWLMTFPSPAMNIQNSHFVPLYSGSRTGSHMAGWSAKQCPSGFTDRQQLLGVNFGVNFFLITPLDTHIDGATILVLRRLKYNCDFFVCLLVALIIPAHSVLSRQSIHLHITDLSFHLCSIPPCFLGILSNWKS